MEENTNKKKKKKKKGSGIKLFGKILLGIFLFILLLLLFIRSPWGQGIITDKLVSYISNKTNTEVQIDKFYIGFGGDLNLEGVFLEDKSGDTLLYSRQLEADIPLWPIIRGRGISIDNLEWKGVRANIKRQDTIEGFNFQFLIDALVPTDTTATAAANDTTSSSMNFSLGDVDLKDFKVYYTDDYMGITTKVDLGSLEIEMQEFNLDSMTFKASDASLEDTRFSYLQSKPFPEQEQQEDPPMPFFSVESLTINNVLGDYESIPDGIATDFDIDRLLLELPEADLDRNRLVVDMLGLRNSEISIKTTTTEAGSSEGKEAEPEESPAFEWPDWTVTAKKVVLQNNRFRLLTGDKRPQEGQFDPGAVQMKDLFFRARDIELQNQSFQANVQKLSFKEASGLNLRESQFNVLINEDKMRIADLKIRANDNSIQGNAVVEYDSLAGFIENPENAFVDVKLPEFNLDLQELYLFQPDLRQNEYFAALAKKNLRGSISAEGKLSAVEIKEANVRWGATTRLAAEGTIYNTTDPQQLRFNFPTMHFSSRRGDIRAFVKEQDLGIKLPEDINLAGSFSGSPEDITVDAVLSSSAGKISVDGRFVTAPGIAFRADLKVTELELGQLLQNQALGALSLEVTASGAGDNLNDLDAIAEGHIGKIVYNGYEFNDIAIAAELEDGEGYANIDYKDENLNMELESFVEMDSVAPAIALKLDVIGADLMALGFSQTPVNAALELNGTFEGNAESYDVTASISDAVFVANNESYLFGDVDMLAHVRPDTTSLGIQNRMLDLKLRSNTDPGGFINAINRHYLSYYNVQDNLDTVENPVNLELRAEVRPSPVLQEVFLPQLEEFDTLNVKVDFNERQKSLAANVNLPYLKYMGAEIDSLAFTTDSDREGLRFDLGLQSLDVGPLAIKETVLEGQLVVEELLLNFSSFYQDSVLINVKSWISREDEILKINIDPENLVLNYKEWDMDPDNEILLGENEWIFNDFRMTHNQQTLEVTDEMPEVTGEHIGILLDNFNLAALFSYLNPEQVLASGKVDGNFIIEEPFGSTGLVADLTVENFAISQVPLGVLSLDANSVGGNTYNFDLALKEGNADLDFTGSYVANPESAMLDMELLLNEIKMEVVEGFAQGEIESTSGSFSGRMDIGGTVAEPVYEGYLDFNQAKFVVAILNTPFIFPDERLRVTNEGFYMDNFEIQDVNGNSFVLNGAVLTETLLNPAFDISFTANNFMALNSSEEDFDLFYGKAVFDATGSLTGDLELPEVELDLEVKEETNLTYVIPEANLEIEERQGVVVFVNRENPDRILTQTQAQEEAFGFSGFLLNSYISVQKNATFTIVLDEETGDHFQASGDGDILYDVYPNGRTTMSGRLDINDGYYEMSLYNLVTRRFDIMDGSSVVWAGDPMDADLNITAVYEVEASASALMAPQLAGADMDTRGRFRQELDFLVYLKIGGEISAPKISFGLDMPEDEQGAISGQVYGRVQQINQQENELNKQVFSLLVLNRFFPDSGSDGTGGGTLSFARDNLNEALSDQLNIFSDRLLGETGIDLNFGLESYTDYQGESPEQRTQLDIAAEKSFMDDRLIVSVGSEVDLQGSSQIDEGSPVLGNVNLEYLLTEDGQLRLRAFRRRSYENVIDGQLIISGLALIFTQDFNKFGELWDQIVKDEKKKQQESQKEPEKTEN